MISTYIDKVYTEFVSYASVANSNFIFSYRRLQNFRFA